MMSVQWALIATFLYTEIAVVILLLIPLITPRTWQKIFRSRFLQSLQNQANLYFTVYIIMLVLFFVDSLREMRKYSVDRDHDQDHGHLDAELQHSMKLFRAQRNFYIAGFALFLCLVIRRLIILISNQATLMAQAEASMKQAMGASKQASDLLKDNRKVRGDSNVIDNEGNDKKEYEIQTRKLREELATAKEELIRYRVNCESMRKQAEAVSSEYDRLMIEHEKLQRDYERVNNSNDVKKDK